MKFMENHLNSKLKDVLAIMQERIVEETYYFGVKTLKNPLDFWIYQELIFDIRPDIVVEIGNCNGGSTLALAHILDNLRHGEIIGIDLSHESVPKIVKEHPRITFIEGDACEVFDQVKTKVKTKKVLIIEDSSHSYENTLNVLRKYNCLVEKGSYFIIEDSICHHGLDLGPNPGPYEAIEDFIKENNKFEIDREKESFFITWNPKGFLKKITD